MENDSKKRILNISYVVLALIAIILILVVLALKENPFASDTWEAIALNIATELLGVVLVFLLLNKLLLGEEMLLSEQVSKLVQRLEKQDTHPPATSYFVPPPRYETLFQQADKIDLIGVVLAATIRSNISNILDGLRAGKQYRIVIAEPSQTGIINSASRSRIKDENYYQNAISGILEDLTRFQQTIQEENLPGSLDVRLSWFPTSYSIRAFDMNKSSGKIYVEIYPHKDPGSPILELQPERDANWFQFFVNQFDNIWESSKPYPSIEENSSEKRKKTNKL